MATAYGWRPDADPGGALTTVRQVSAAAIDVVVNAFVGRTGSSNRPVSGQRRGG